MELLSCVSITTQFPLQLCDKRLTLLARVVVNYIQRELPPGSTTGASGTNGTPGALGLGQRASTGLTLCKYTFANEIVTIYP